MPAVLAMALAPPGAGAGQPGRSLEYPVKASLLLNFAKFAEWPAGSIQATSPTVTICVLGTDPFGDVLDATVAGRSAGGRPIEVRRHRQLDGVETCHVLFIAPSERGRLAQSLGRLRQLPILTVGEGRDFGDQGGIIGLVTEDNRAQFSVNLGPAEFAHLKLSSQLLGVARSVRGGAAW
jgi:hypothetical protein